MEMLRQELLTSASLADQSDFVIGELEVSPARRVVHGPGGTAKVEPRVMQVLVMLAEAGGAVVTREALLDRCWGGVFVGDDSLNRAIAGVRRLAASPGGGSFEIETVPRTGYRLIVNRAAAGQDAPAAAGRGMSRRRMVASGLVAGALVAGSSAWWWQQRPASARGGAQALIDQSAIALRSGRPEGAQEAIALLERAATQFPDDARAWGALALTRARIDEHATDKGIYPVALIDREANTALRLDPGNADALSALALAIPYYGDWLAAERRFDGILADHPTHHATRDARAFLLAAVGRVHESARDRLKFSGGIASRPRSAVQARLCAVVSRPHRRGRPGIRARDGNVAWPSGRVVQQAVASFGDRTVGPGNRPYRRR